MNLVRTTIDTLVKIVDKISVKITGKRIIGYNNPEPARLEDDSYYFKNYYHYDDALNELYNEVVQDRLSDINRQILCASRAFTEEVICLDDLFELDFIDFYESLNEDLQISIQFSSALKKISEFNFKHHKLIREHDLSMRDNRYY